ncbi:ImmA/IrrE family metallo-endopeptidase [Corynebacterium urealyticum]|uniref:IrrE N-terminal-like domain-containing protein n=1 Tax=Corynebacterium urealyticum (strain ATCC 43042 / DSM 7109) TaxID=504474 RepID=B1VFI8_CORU7|nr:ImmA/IrrE family metallo-endopeptidase [Corynebacterium urealyticum]QQE51871.1 ImmA/IrrE family metallo-endopeptidase [Corynebacterium urealyticum]CAQ04527.1 hypothetical protein cu0567 [Corynebacterium urealyticum DSM 7109]SNV95971.1 Domain of uncharacterised function (DUF955) [Corynebacterium urealyticum]
MSITQYRSTLAHELGHAYYGDEPTGNGHYDQGQEARTDEYAARLLIPRATFATAYRGAKATSKNSPTNSQSPSTYSPSTCAKH